MNRAAAITLVLAMILMGCVSTTHSLPQHLLNYLDSVPIGTEIRTIEDDLYLEKPVRMRAPSSLDPLWRFEYRLGQLRVGFAADFPDDSAGIKRFDDSARFKYMGGAWCKPVNELPRPD